LFVTTASPADVAAALPVLYQAVRPALETARENQVPPLRIVDGVLLQKFTVEGDAVKGFLVRVSGEQLNDSIWRVAIERGEARILAPGAMLAALGTVSEQLNNRAWTAVVADKVDRQALEDALSAVKETRQENASCLHTLAAVYAELGKTPEALENLRRAVEIRGQRIAEEDWYVLGRIAEDYGLAEVAAGLYRKAPTKPAPGASGLYALAQRRLKKMGK
jgi:tetratricopeptide (TPR) repeat protein